MDTSTAVGALQPSTLYGLLQRAAFSYPKHGLTFLDAGLENFISYADLLQQAHDNGSKLRDAGIVKEGEIIIICFDNHRCNVVWTWSVIAAGGSPAILPPFSNDPKTRDSQLQNLQKLFGKPSVLTSLSLMGQLACLPDASKHAVESIQSPDKKMTAQNGACGYDARTPDSLAVLLFTSGSTGNSKAVEYTHRQLLTSVRSKQQLHKLDSSVTFMSWISFDHSANFCELHLSAMYVGSNQYFVPTSDLAHQPDHFFELLGRYRIGYTFTPNSFLAAATKAWEQRKPSAETADFQHLKVVMVGGEANKVATLEHADRVLRAGGAGPNAVKAAYGLSETCSACFYNLQTPSWDLEQGNLFATVGEHVPIGLEFRLVGEGLMSVPHGQDGCIQLRGDIVFSRYHNDELATASCMTFDGWFDTGDLGRLDSNGNLAIVGRSKEILILGGNNYSSFELEHAIESRKIPGVSTSWTATFSVWDHERNTEGVVVLFSATDEYTNDQEQLRATIRRIDEAVLMFCSTTPLDVIPLPSHEMPKSTIGKLSRQKLKKFYLEGQFDKYRVKRSTDIANGRPAKPLVTEMQRTVAKLLAEQSGLCVEQIGADSEIAQFDMSSIAYLRLKRSLELAINGVDNPIRMGAFLEARAVEDLAALAESRERSQYRPLITLRAEGSQPPLFLFPPAGGECIIWLPLVKYLPDRPVFALQAKGLERNSKGTFAGLEDMLDTYESAILSVHPTGPYALLGLCFGGTIAFEIGKRLERRAHTIAFCGGLDNPANLQNVLSIGEDRSTIQKFLVDLLAYHKVISDDEVHALDQRYATLPESDAIAAITADFRDRGGFEAGLHADKVDAWYKVNSVAHRIARTYVPKGTVRRYDVFWANPYSTWNLEVKEWEGLIKTWEPFTREGCGYRWLPGHHFSLLNEENVERLATALLEAMREQEKPVFWKNTCVCL